MDETHRRLWLKQHPSSQALAGSHDAPSHCDSAGSHYFHNLLSQTKGFLNPEEFSRIWEREKSQIQKDGAWRLGR